MYHESFIADIPNHRDHVKNDDKASVYAEENAMPSFADETRDAGVDAVHTDDHQQHNP